MTRQIPTIPTHEKITLRVSEAQALSGLSKQKAEMVA